MKTIITLSVFCFLILNSAFSCTFVPNSFCITTWQEPNDLMVSGYITGVDADGIDFEIIHILRGVESKTNIRIWDGSDFDCNGPFSMAASDFGAVNDSLILILPKIGSIENSWDVIGDYRRPDDYVKTPRLKLENGVVKGFIRGDAYAPPHFNLLTFPYDEFINSWDENQDCSEIVSTKNIIERDDISVYPNPAYSSIQIGAGSYTTAKFTSVKIINTIGEEIQVFTEVSSNSDLPIQNLSTGVHYLLIEDEENIVIKRFVKF